MLQVAAPSGRGAIAVDSSVGSAGQERASLVAEETGDYAVRVAAFDPQVVAGRYRIWIETLRPATSEDRVRARAQAAWLEGARLTPSPEESSRRTAVERFRRAASLWRAVEDRRQEALALFHLAILQRNLGDLRGSLESYRSACDSASASGDQQLYAKTLNGLGAAVGYLGDFDKDVEAQSQALRLARSVGDRQSEADALRSRGWAYWLQGQYQKALDDYEPALSLAISLKDRQSLAWTWNGLGLAYASMGELDKALDRFERAVPLAHAVSDAATEAFSRQNMGYAYWRLGAFRKALECFEAVLPGRRAAGEKQDVALLLNNIGLAHLSLGEAAVARANFEDALSIWTAQGNERSRVLAFLNLGLAFQKLREPDRAIADWKQARDLAVRLGLRDQRAAALAFLAGADADRDDLDAARSEIEEALEILERARGEIQFSPLRASFLSSKQNGYAIERDVLLRLHERFPQRGFDAEAFRASERGRAREMTESILEAHVDLSGDLPDDLRRREREVGERIHRLEREPATAEAAGDSPGNRLVEAEEDWKRLIVEMRRREPLYASLVYPQPISAERARSLLGPESAIVSFSIDSRRLLVFVLTQSRLDVRRLAVPPAELAERVENYVGLIARDGRDLWGPLSERLYEDVVRPWRESLPRGVRSLVILPDGVLGSLPFEALQRPGRPPRRMIEDFAISYAPSATVLALLQDITRTPPPRDPGRILVVADPRSPAGAPKASGAFEGETFDLAPLPYAASEARAVARFGGPGSEVDIGTDASEARLAGRSLAGFRVIHFATHGLLSRRVPSRSALLLAADRDGEGLLTAREIYRLRLDSDLVVLSACETARGRILAGEGVESLAQAFFHAGARSVVASLWDVSDRRTADLMSDFYAHLARGERKAQALRSAKLDLLRGSPELAPRFWASFVLLGEPAGTVPLRAPRWWERFFGMFGLGS